MRLLWSGQTVSVLGSRASALAFPLLVLELTQSPAKAGVVGIRRLSAGCTRVELVDDQESDQLVRMVPGSG